MKKWLYRALLFFCLTALCLAIWFAGPLIGYGDIRPLGAVWIRLLLIFLIVFSVGLYYGISYWRRRKAAAALEDALTEVEEVDEGDAPVLSERMTEALTVLKESSGSTAYLYDLPWYMIIGPPGAGKTTALVNSGLKFPLADRDGATPVSGVGGTRYCDWWFTEDAVLIDTAGRYTTQDSEIESDKKSWLSFLALLKTHRARQPINGVIVAISIEDVLKLEPAELVEHSTAIRKRLLEIHSELKIDFPVYVIFTKADLISGFTEYFGNFTESRRRKVWGATFQTEDRKVNMIGQVPSEFDALVVRLTEELTDRLHEEPDGVSRIAIFGFPTQFAMLKDKVSDFLNKIFEKNRYQVNANLRGFYFTSGTQEGTPIDQVLGAMDRGFGGGGEGRHLSGTGRSYFLHDLLKSVIFGESGWVSSDPKAVRRAAVMRYGAYGVLGCLAVFLAGMWGWSFYNNKRLVDSTATAVASYRVNAAEELASTTVSDHDLLKVVGLLSQLRNMPVGYEVRDQDPTMPERFGLSQRERLNSASETTYRKALERMFRSRLILRLEKQIEFFVNNNDPLANYEALKVYLMLGGKAPKVDEELILAWMKQDWRENLYPGPDQRPGRNEMETHLKAMLELDDGKQPVFELNGPLVESAQRSIARMNIADQAYALIQSATHSAVIEDFVLAARAGPDAALALETVDGSELSQLRVPMLYTYSGFHDFFLDQLGDVAAKLDAEQWVMGEFSEQEAISQQFQRLGPQLLDRYGKDFEEKWLAMLNNVKFKPVSGDKPHYQTLNVISSPTSPFKLLLEAVARETQLTKDREVEGETPGVVGGEVGGSAQSELAKELVRRTQQRATGLKRIGIDIALRRSKSQLRAGGVGGGPAPRIPGANIEAKFARYHSFVEGDPGSRPVDAVVANFNEIYKSLVLASAASNQAELANANLQLQIANLKASSSRLPKTATRMVTAAVDDLEGDAANSSIAQMNQMLASSVTRDCQRVVSNRYPFNRGSGRDVPMADFARLFAPNGVFDRFFSQNLAPLADMADRTWRWKDDSRMGRGLSKAALRNFQRASEIRDAFFPSGGSQPGIGLTVSQYALHGEVESALLSVNGQVMQTQQVGNSPINIDWPGSTQSGSVSVSLSPEIPGRSSTITINGPWSLMRLIDAGKPQRKGDVLRVRYPIGGRYVSYNIQVASVSNPFFLRALSDFKCPTGL